MGAYCVRILCVIITHAGNPESPQCIERSPINKDAPVCVGLKMTSWHFHVAPL